MPSIGGIAAQKGLSGMLGGAVWQGTARQPGMWSQFVRSLDLQNAMRMTRMGLRFKQTGGVLGAYFRGATLPRAGDFLPGDLNTLGVLPGNAGTAAARIAAAGIGGMAALSMLPRSDAIAIPAAMGAFGAAYSGLGAIPALGGSTLGSAIRVGGGLMAGSIAWGGLRSPRMSDYA